uniref:Thiamin biosynthesis protein S n=1 Tax=Polysiphonia sp. TaxID=1967842 RepID=A0A1Z1MTY9_9FLOR|nr:thiamin biosynthesis protein S [Polysiphonia sp.]
MKKYFTVFINGDPFNCDSSISLFELLRYLNVNIDNVIIEYNNIIVHKTQFNDLYFKSNDFIEIISVVGGG